MHTRLWIAGLVAATPILALSPVAFPASDDPGCARATVGARYNQRLFTSLMRRKDDIATRTLELYSVPLVQFRDVKPVSDPATCARAALAFGRAVNDAAPNRKVHIVRVGDRYVVMDPGYKPDDFHRAVTFDSTFSKPFAVVAED